MTVMLWIRVAAVGLFVISGARTAAAGPIVIGNLPFIGAGGQAQANLIPGEYAATGFTMGAVSLELESATLQLQGLSGASASVFINDTPDLITPLVSLGSMLIGGSAEYTFTPVVPFTLAAATTYYLVYAPVGAQVFWFGDLSGNTPTGPFATDAGTFILGSSRILDFDYQINAVPEPSTLAIFATAALVGLGRRRLRRDR